MEAREQEVSKNGFCEYYAEPFRHWIIDDWFDPCTLEEMAELRESKHLEGCNISGEKSAIDKKVYWFCDTHAANLGTGYFEWEAHYNNDIEHGKRTSRSFDKMPDKIRTAFIKLRHEDTVREWHERTGIYSLMDDPVAHGAGLHKSDNGSFLQVHLDYARHPEFKSHERKLNLLFFMHPEWRSEWGGQLLLCDPIGQTIKAIDPLPGRLVAFEVSDLSYHGVRVIQGAKMPRLSCAVYYIALAKDNPTRQRAMFFPNRSNGGIPHEVR